MKKFLICLFILMCFFCVGFFFGWTQFRVKPEEIGVVISKTNGIDNVPVENGRFAWHWQFLIPTNAELKTFSIKPLNVTKKIEGTLPSGNFYASYGEQNVFSYSFDFSISLTVSPESVIQLLKINQITSSEDLSEYLDRSADTIAQLASDFYLKKVQDNPKFRIESVRKEDLFRSIQIYKECPLVELANFSLVSSKIPDFELYDYLKRQFFTNVRNDSSENSNGTKNEKIFDEKSKKNHEENTESSYGIQNEKTETDAENENFSLEKNKNQNKKGGKTEFSSSSAFILEDL